MLINAASHTKFINNQFHTYVHVYWQTFQNEKVFYSRYFLYRYTILFVTEQMYTPPGDDNTKNK